MRTVLITGTSSGIGLLSSVEMAKRGWSVIATMRDLARRGELDRQLAAAGLERHVSVEQLDVSVATSIDAFITRLANPIRPLDAVVHNAGIAVGGAFEDLDDALFRRVMEVNFFGVLALTRRLLPIFRAQRRGRIVIISSEVAFAGQPTVTPYCASKWAVEGWAESIAYELEPFNIQVSLIEPGPFRTNIWEASPRIIPANSPYRPLLRHLDVAVDAHVERAAGDPQDVADAVAMTLEAERPRFRRAVGRLALINHFLRGKVPSSVLRKIVSRYFALDQIRW